MAPQRDRTLIERVELQKPCSQYTYGYIRFLQLAGHFMVLPKSDCRSPSLLRGNEGYSQRKRTTYASSLN
ncbi:hypothetical protein [Coleofasciculus sp. E2-BRE-01]|uniref:hypothetical protein n=1 Tax=Coleofasciculus sp. E2-BRE-01 TaxID=3069524 RepID=UPI0040645488